MTMIVRFALLGALAVGSAACDGFSRAVTSHTDILARAAGHELTVDQASSMIAPHTQIPNRPEVVEAVANLWVDYTLLATAAAQDSLLRQVNVDVWLRPMMEQQAVHRLRDQVIQVDTTISDDELRAQYEQDGPLEVRARHILMNLPSEATQAQRDSVLARMQQVRERAVGGEDFAALATEFGQDGTAAQGGDLGFFGRGEMLAPFEQAAFSTAEGDVSDVVETVAGFHIIKVEERRLPDFEEIKDSFRTEVANRRLYDATTAYIDDLTEPRKIQVQDGAVENAKAIALKPDMNLRGRAASRPLVRYEGGAFTAASFLDMARTWDPGQRGQFGAAADTDVQRILEQLTRDQILVQEAVREGLEPSPAEQDTMRLQVRSQLAAAARAAGLTSIQPQDGETMYQAIDRKVRGYLDAIMRGEQNAIPLGVIGFALREQYGGEIFDRSFGSVVTRVEQSRPATSPPGPIDSPAPLPVPVPDTTATTGG